MPCGTCSWQIWLLVMCIVTGSSGVAGALLLVWAPNEEGLEPLPPWMEEKEKNRFKEIIDNYTEDSSKRNRSRIMEMFQFVKASKEEIENILEEDAVEEDEYDDL